MQRAGTGEAQVMPLVWKEAGRGGAWTGRGRGAGAQPPDKSWLGPWEALAERERSPPNPGPPRGW